MVSDLILRVVYNGVTTDLDVDIDVPLRLDISAVQNTDIGKVYGIGSQTFYLPGTNKNNRFFNHAYNVAAEDIPAFYSTVQAYAISNGETVLSGRMKLNEVVTDEDGFISYNVSLEDQTVEFNEALKDKFLYEADWSDLNHTINATAVTSSWYPRSQGDFLNGAVFYPLVDYGFDKRFTLDTIPRLSTDIATGSSANSNFPLQFQQFLPAVGVREVFDKIFQQAGFNYTSTLIDGSDFDDLFVLFKNQEDLGVVTTTTPSNLFSASFANDFTVSSVSAGSSNTFTMPFTASVYDPGSNYDTAIPKYTVPASGDYTVEMNIQFNNSSQDAGPDGDQTAYIAEIHISQSGGGVDIQDLGEERLLSGDTDNPYQAAGEGVFTFTAGDIVIPKLKIDNTAAQSPTTATTILEIGDVTSSFAITSAPIDYEDLPVTMSQQIDESIKTIDIFRGLIEQFNLVVVPDQTQEKSLIVETFDTWIRSGERKDWTYRYDTAKRIAISNPVTEQQRELKFENNQDKDRISELTQDQTPNFQYGTLRVISDSDLTSGDETLGSFFAPSVLGPTNTSQTDFFTNQNNYVFNQGSPNFIVPHLYKYNNNKLESFKFKPRIGYRTYYTGSSTGQSDLTAPSLQYLISSSGTYSFNNYSTLSNYENYPVSASTKDLLFNSSYGKISNSGTLYPSSGSSNYKNYWETYIESIYWEDGKKVTMDLYFEPYEYQDIKLNDQIIINNQVYRINKIKGFNITKRDVVTVELLRLYPELIAVPQGPSVVSPTPTPSPSVSPSITPTPSTTPAIPGSPSPTPSVTPSNTPAFVCEELTIGANSSGDFVGATGTCCDGTLFDERVEDYGEVTICIRRGTETITRSGGYVSYGGSCTGCV